MRRFQVKREKSLPALLTALVTLGALMPAAAIDYQWKGGFENNKWEATANWTPAGIPATGDSVLIKSGSTLQLGSDKTINNFTLERGATLTLSGKLFIAQNGISNGLILGGGIFTTNVGGTSVFNIGVAHSGTTPVTVNYTRINTNGTTQVNVESSVAVNFPDMVNNGNMTLNAAGPVTFKTIKTYHTMTVETSAGARFTALENWNGGTLNLVTTSPAFPAGSNVPVLIEDIRNYAGSRVSLKGFAAGELAFRTKAIKNYGIMSYESAKIIMEADLMNYAEAEIIIAGGAHIHPVPGTLGKVESYGVVRKIGAGDSDIFMHWDNRGEVRLEEGLLRVRPSAGLKYSQLAGKTTLLGGGIQLIKPDLTIGEVDISGGQLDGSGTIHGDVVHTGGNIRAGFSPGSITINGNYTQTANGTLDMEIAGTSAGAQYDQINVMGTVTLAGTINLTYLNGFLPKDGDNFQLVTYYGLSGSWSNYNGFNPIDTINISKTLTPTYFVVSANGVDTTPPAVSVASPVNNQFLKTNPSVSGTASDINGIGLVTVLVYRYAVDSTTAGYWNGTSWDANYAETLHERTATGTTSWTYSLPTLADGKYYVRAKAKDKNGNVATSSNAIFTKDSVVPATLTITVPTNKAFVKSIDTMQGTAIDNTNGSGVDRVKLLLKRNADNHYWTGSGWVTVGQFIKADSDGAEANGWTRRHSAHNATGPQGTHLKIGSYTITDAALMIKQATENLKWTTFKVDATAPTLMVTAPVNNTVYASQPTATGTVADSGGSGVASVKVRLYRFAASGVTAGYWAGGTTWSATYTAANDRLATGTSNWSLTLPTLTNGNYSLEAIATDKAGNSTVSPLVSFSRATTTAAVVVSQPSIAINDVSLSEGNSGSKNLTFTVTLSKSSSQSVTVKYATADGIARSTSDYTAKSGTLSFSAGQTSKAISVVIKGDAVIEGDETLFILLTNATNASIGQARGTGTILNDDIS